MRHFVKECVNGLLDVMGEEHREIAAAVSMEDKIQLLRDCQQAAIAIGNTVENEGGADVVPVLEQYCEELYKLSQKEDLSIKNVMALDKMTNQVRSSIKDIPETYHVVFFPYKAAMWDSLESIWKECNEDETCECCVVPIPYFQFDIEKQKWDYCYEGEEFPEDVPVINYKKYSLEKLKPDIAYIHNPYDNRNYVTSVDPDYYSHELKKYVRNLVYVPYYVTSGGISPEHLDLPVYQNMDYMIVQSEYAKECCKGMNYYHKVLPFGSPKFDSIIHAYNIGGCVPDLWKPILSSKKSVMLNTSIAQVLNSGLQYFEKIKYISDLIQSHEKLVLVWRPHPLLEATIKSMRPALMTAYQELMADLKIKTNVIIDQTPDITNTVTLTDAYIGEIDSSVVNLFSVTGKPIFILDNFIVDDWKPEERRRLQIRDIKKMGNQLWFTAYGFNGLFRMDLKDRKVHFEGWVENHAKWVVKYPCLAFIKDKVYLSPRQAGCPAAYDTSKKSFYMLWETKEDIGLDCYKIADVNNKLYYLPAMNGVIMEYNTKTGVWKYHEECIRQLVGDAATGPFKVLTWDWAESNGSLWVTAPYVNRILQFNVNTGNFLIHEIGNETNGFSGVIAEGDDLWLAETHYGNILKWNSVTKEIQTYNMPKDFNAWTSKGGINMPHSSLIDMGRYLLTVPGYSNIMVRLDKESGIVSAFAAEFWEHSAEKGNRYSPDHFMSGIIGINLDGQSVLVQRNYDLAIAIIDVETESYHMFYPEMDKLDFNDLIKNEDGFEKINDKSAFYRSESKMFLLDDFFRELEEGRIKKIKERQLKEVSAVAANLDGTCGKKVHEYLMREMCNKNEFHHEKS